MAEDSIMPSPSDGRRQEAMGMTELVEVIVRLGFGHAFAAGGCRRQEAMGMTELVEVIVRLGFGHAFAAGDCRRQEAMA
ncbi:hypothetical protein Rhe02_39670 [Rhizocola hellebori]|uniref:Uncharacterized protein n=1 Tax=Rhizocola hellebori TaxID=1392758 RepID=A0A8J3QA78_9ACTN|nr:hypothetical protein [Rhizocola hellebori]GIH05900.1 hypothetical protein Rhe02_39670 [Rhizocola hellebori]